MKIFDRCFVEIENFQNMRISPSAQNHQYPLSGNRSEARNPRNPTFLGAQLHVLGLDLDETPIENFHTFRNDQVGIGEAF